MNPTKITRPQYPQTVAVPAPLEIHPSIDPEFARGLLAAVEYIEADPADRFNMNIGVMDFREGIGNGRGCFLCHAEKLSKWRANMAGGGGYNKFEFWDNGAPLGHPVRIYSPEYWCGLGFDHNTTEGRLARCSHFLSTGE